MFDVKLRRFKDIALYYETDINQSIIVRFRTYGLSGTDTVVTPLPSLVLQRKVTTDDLIPKVNFVTPRKFITCFLNAVNQSGISELSTVTPYKPLSPENKVIALELKNLEGSLRVEYNGENN